MSPFIVSRSLITFLILITSKTYQEKREKAQINSIKNKNGVITTDSRKIY